MGIVVAWGLHGSLDSARAVVVSTAGGGHTILARAARPFLGSPPSTRAAAPRPPAAASVSSSALCRAHWDGSAPQYFVVRTHVTQGNSSQAHGPRRMADGYHGPWTMDTMDHGYHGPPHLQRLQLRLARWAVAPQQPRQHPRAGVHAQHLGRRAPLNIFVTRTGGT
jgi:hypothetical protein